MDGLNSSVITGKCSGCTAYRGKLKEARKKLAAVEEMRTERAARFSKDDEWWIRGLDRILKGGD